MDQPLVRTAEVSAFSAIPGLHHGFERRCQPVGAESRDETRERVFRALAPQGRLLFLEQTHGTVLHEAPWMGRPEGDASYARAPGQLLGIETADCLPILYVDPRQRSVAAAHAGWRGTAQRIAVQVFETMKRHGSRPEDIQVALGPCIGPCCYDVGEAPRAAFGALAPSVFSRGSDGRPRLDIRQANAAQLGSAGLPPGHMHHVAECTKCRPDLYHSYRRDGLGGGRMISFVGFGAD